MNERYHRTARLSSSCHYMDLTLRLFLYRNRYSEALKRLDCERDFKCRRRRRLTYGTRGDRYPDRKAEANTTLRLFGCRIMNLRAISFTRRLRHETLPRKRRAKTRLSAPGPVALVPDVKNFPGGGLSLPADNSGSTNIPDGSVVYVGEPYLLSGSTDGNGKDWRNAWLTWRCCGRLPDNLTRHVPIARSFAG